MKRQLSLSDGVTEQYIAREHAILGINERSMFSVDHVTFAGNVEGPNM